MQIILLERIEKLGQMGDLVNVKTGYARNFLIPQGKALRATKANTERFEAERAQREANNLELRKDAETEAGKMRGLAVSMVRAASEMGQLFGSVTSRDIADAITEAGFTIGNLKLDRPVKSHFRDRDLIGAQGQGLGIAHIPISIGHRFEDAVFCPCLRQ